MQYLGKIPFPLYLVHQSVYHLVRYPVRNFLWHIATREQYPRIETASQFTIPFAFTWLVGYLIMAVFNLYAAHL